LLLPRIKAQGWRGEAGLSGGYKVQGREGKTHRRKQEKDS